MCNCEQIEMKSHFHYIGNHETLIQTTLHEQFLLFSYTNPRIDKTEGYMCTHAAMIGVVLSEYQSHHPTQVACKKSLLSDQGLFEF